MTLARHTLLLLIDQYTHHHGFSPTVRELQQDMNFSSPDTIRYHLAALETQGFIKREAYAHRNIALTALGRIYAQTQPEGAPYSEVYDSSKEAQQKETRAKRAEQVH